MPAQPSSVLRNSTFTFRSLLSCLATHLSHFATRFSRFATNLLRRAGHLCLSATYLSPSASYLSASANRLPRSASHISRPVIRFSPPSPHLLPYARRFTPHPKRNPPACDHLSPIPIFNVRLTGARLPVSKNHQRGIQPSTKNSRRLYAHQARVSRTYFRQPAITYN